MITITALAKIVILALCVWGAVAVGVFPARNGFLPIFTKILESGNLPGSDIPVRTKYTGIAGLDAYLTALVLFFWMMVNGHCPDISLHSIEFLGQGAAIWVVVLIEGSRAGNKGRLVSFVTTLGVIIQFASLSINMPAYLALHLFTSPTVSGLSPSAVLSQLGLLQSIPLSLTLGYLLPVLLMSLPAPSLLSYDQKQIFIAVFQPFPVLVYMISSISAYLSRKENAKLSTKESSAKYRTALRQAYIFGLASAIVCHVGSWTLSLTAATFPQIFTAEHAAAWHPSMVFQLVGPLSGIQVPSPSRGAIWMLQWGLFNGSIAFIFWATTLYINCRVAQKKEIGLISTLGKIILTTVVAGPAGAALLLIWERDEQLLDLGAAEKKKS